MAITKIDVSREAGVSHMTVSRVLSNYKHVSKDKRQKVLAACKKLNYRPNVAAMTMRNKKSYAMGVVIPTFKHTFYARFLDKLEEEAKKINYHVISVQSKTRNEHNNIISWEDIEFLLARQVDGLFIFIKVSSEIHQKLKKENIPVVFVDYFPEDDYFPFVGTADFSGAKTLTDWLIQCGHKKIAFIGGHKNHYTSEQRLAGYRAALADHNLTFSPELVLHTSYGLDLEDGSKKMSELLDSKLPFSAVIGANDYIAIGALAACYTKGVKVPDNVSVVGFTGDEIGAYTNPPLTTMSQNIEEIAKAGFKMMNNLIETKSYSHKNFFSLPELVKRQSVKII